MQAGTVPSSEIGLWRQGELVAHDRPVAEIVRELRPWFGGTIVITSDDAARRRVTGVYQLRNPVEARRAVARAHDSLSVTQLLPWLVIV
jgi:transmembrane sensor